MTVMVPRFILDPNWYTEITLPGVDCKLPGLYEWRIEQVGIYVGQYTRSTRPRREYGKNVANILSNRPYRKGKPTAFRAVHQQLAQAVRDQRRITLTILENEIDKAARNRLERELIMQRRREADQGGLPVLNSN